MKDLNDYQDDITKIIHNEFLRSEERNEKAFDKFKLKNSTEHQYILDEKEKTHAVILGKIDRSIEVSNALASEMRGCYSTAELKQTELEKKQAIYEAEFAPIKKLYSNLTSALIGFLIVVGTVFVSLVYFLRDKLK